MNHSFTLTLFKVISLPKSLFMMTQGDKSFSLTMTHSESRQDSRDHLAEGSGDDS